jgi:hypothetical protein
MKQLFCIFFLFYTFVYSQELIRNPSFEDNQRCPSLSGTTRFDMVDFWDITYQNPDPTLTYFGSYYFNKCDSDTNVICLRNSSVPLSLLGYSYAYKGNAYVGIYTFNNSNEDFVKTRRLFISQQLKTNLDAEAKYDVSMFVSFADNYNVFNNSLHVLFSPTFTFFLTDFIGGGAINLSDFHPQVKFEDYGYQLNVVNGWQEVNGSFVADGSERFITIGNFKNNNESDTSTWGFGQPNGYCGWNWGASFYFIDDVSLTLGIDAGKDTVICTTENKNLPLKASAGWQHYTWYLQGNAIDTGRAITINIPGTYIVKGTVDSLPNYAKYDTVVVSATTLSNAFYASTVTADTTICTGTQAALRIYPTQNNFTYEWSNGATSQTTNIQDSGTYSVRIYESNCYKTEHTHVSFFDQQALLDSAQIHLTNLNHIITANPGFTKYTWSTGDTTKQISISASALKAGWLRLSAYTSDGCLVHDSVFVNYQELPIIIPNPQQSGKGNVFTILNLPSNSLVYVYDHLGKQVLQSTNYSNNFVLDFTASALYYYKIVLSNGEVINGKVFVV